jgi:hypothetical protein
MEVHPHAAFSVVFCNLGIFCTIYPFLRSRCPTALTMTSRPTFVTPGGSSLAKEILSARRIRFQDCVGHGFLEDMGTLPQSLRFPNAQNSALLRTRPCSMFPVAHPASACVAGFAARQVCYDHSATEGVTRCKCTGTTIASRSALPRT